MERHAVIVAGLGFRTGAPETALADAYARAAQGRTVVALASVSSKAETPAFRALADRLDLPVVAVDVADIAAQRTATQSAAAQAAYGTGSVAEAAALAAAGQGARLIGPRCVSADRMATCALAEGDGP